MPGRRYSNTLEHRLLVNGTAPPHAAAIRSHNLAGLLRRHQVNVPFTNLHADVNLSGDSGLLLAVVPYVEVNVVIDLPAAYIGAKGAKSAKKLSAHAARTGGTQVPGVLAALVDGRTKVALEREWRLTMALALKQLPSGACLTVRDSGGRQWYIGPAAQAWAAQGSAAQAGAAGLREAA